MSQYNDTIRRLYNLLANKGWLTEPNQVPGNRTHVLTKYLPDLQEQYECWLIESILSGLATDDKKIAYRCSLQATEYSAKLANNGGSCLSDARMELRNRVESFLT